tara:strand:+ start:46 stop:255 length:210 start_codon:yes stop_codon:yes gene_type:complete
MKNKKGERQMLNKDTYKINQKVWLYRTDIRGYTLGYVTGFTEKRISAYNYTLDRIGHYKPEHIKLEERA